MATESPKIMSYFIPDLGPAPKWCSYLDNITDELDEESQPAVYDDYKFVTREELEALGASPPQPPFRGASPVIQQYLLPTPPCLRYSPCKPCALSPPPPCCPPRLYRALSVAPLCCRLYWQGWIGSGFQFDFRIGEFCPEG